MQETNPIQEVKNDGTISSALLLAVNGGFTIL